MEHFIGLVNIYSTNPHMVTTPQNNKERNNAANAFAGDSSL